MARNPNVKIFWPADDKGERSALALPYTIGLVQNGPNSENGKKLINFLLDKPAQSSVSARDRKSTRLNSSHSGEARMPSSA